MTDFADVQACIPQPMQIVIDDVGWRCGRDDSSAGGPFRTGITRDHVPADYQAIADLGRLLNMRPQAGMILCEWDVKNRLAQLPSSTWMGAAWDNACNHGQWMADAAEIIRHNRGTHFEFVLHGVGHEYWLHAPAGSAMTRAEWHDEAGAMRPDVDAHLDAFAAIMADHQLGPFPTAFIPCAFYHHFGHPRFNLAQKLAARGVTSISTDFRKLTRSAPLLRPHIGFDHGLITVDRGQDLCGWRQLDPPADVEPTWPIIGMHWPNILHQDPQRNGEVVNRWVRLLKPMGDRFDRLLSPCTDAFVAQLMHAELTEITLDGPRLTVDASAFFRQPWIQPPDQPVVVKLRAREALTARDEQGKAVRSDSVVQAGRIITRLELVVSKDRPRATFMLGPQRVAQGGRTGGGREI